MADEKPRTRENPFELILIDLGCRENIPADRPIGYVYEVASILLHPVLPHLASPLR